MDHEQFDKTSPENASCISRAHLGEPMFVLLGRDPAMGETIRAWCRERSLAIVSELRPNTEAEIAHVRAAVRLAEAADAYFKSLNDGSKQRQYEESRRLHRAAVGVVHNRTPDGLVNIHHAEDGRAFYEAEQARRAAEKLAAPTLPGETPNDELPLAEGEHTSGYLERVEDQSYLDNDGSDVLVETLRPEAHEDQTQAGHWQEPPTRD